MPADGGVFELGEELDERLAERGHDVGRVVLGETADDDDGHLAHVELFVVERNEERAHVLGLCEVAVELLLCAKLAEHGPSELGIRVGDADGHEFVEHVVDDLDGVHAGLAADGIVDKEVGAGLCCGLTNGGMVVLEVG